MVWKVRFSGAEKKHLDLIAQLHSVFLQLILNLLISLLPRLVFGAHATPHLEFDLTSSKDYILVEKIVFRGIQRRGDKRCMLLLAAEVCSSKNISWMNDRQCWAEAT